MLHLHAAMPSSEDHPETGLGDRAGKPGAIGERRNDVQEAEEIPREQDYVMVGEDSSREQVCKTPSFKQSHFQLSGVERKDRHTEACSFN